MRHSLDTCLVLFVALWLVGCGEDAAAPRDAGTPDAGSDAADAPAETDVDQPLETIAIETGSISLRVTIEPFGFELGNAAGEVVLETWSLPVEVPGDPAEGAYGPPAATRELVSSSEGISWGWATVESATDPWTAFDETRSAELDRGTVQLRLGSSERPDLELDVALAVAENVLHVEMTLSGDDGGFLNRLGQSFTLADDEHILGLGGQLTRVDHRGTSHTFWVEETGLGLGEGHPPGPENPFPNGEAMTPFPVPFMLSTAGYGLWIEAVERGAVHLGSHTDGLWRLEVSGQRLAYGVAVNADPMRTVADFTAETGRPGLPPEWAFGPRRRMALDATVEGEPEWLALRDHGVATTTIEDRLDMLPLGEHLGREDALEGDLLALHDFGFKVLGLASPMVAADLESTAALFESGSEAGYFVTDAAGRAYRMALLGVEGVEVTPVDLTRADARMWFEDSLRAGIALGYDGFRVHYGEYIPPNAHFADGRTGESVHNLYPTLVHDAVAELVGDELGSDGVLVASSGYLGSAVSTPLVWLDGANGSFDEADGLPAVLRAGINLSVSGLPFYGSDIGGNQSFNDPPTDRETYLRWTEMAALSPMMQDENLGVGSRDASERWTLWSDDLTLEVYARYAQLHTQLAPYLHSLARDASESGFPMVRSLYLVHPDDPDAIAIDDQYYLGPALMVAPVVTRGARTRVVYLPAQRYVHWETGEVLSGPGPMTVDAPLDSLPLFRADGGIVPMYDPRLETLAPEDHPDVVGLSDVGEWLDVLAVRSPGRSSFTLADGTLLSVEVTGTVGPPFTTGDTDLPFVLTRDQTTECAGCYLLREGEPRVLWVTTPLSENIEVVGAGIRLGVTNPPTRARRVRWEVVLLPGVMPQQE